MPRILLSALLSLCLPCGCSSASSSPSATSPDGSSAACSDASGTWTITAHCDASYIGMKAVVTQTDCTLSFAMPFNGFTGTVAGATITLSGPQSCTGTVMANSISMMCTPGTCDVALSR